MKALCHWFDGTYERRHLVQELIEIIHRLVKLRLDCSYGSRWTLFVKRIQVLRDVRTGAVKENSLALGAVEIHDQIVQLRLCSIEALTSSHPAAKRTYGNCCKGKESDEEQWFRRWLLRPTARLPPAAAQAGKEDD